MSTRNKSRWYGRRYLYTFVVIVPLTIALVVWFLPRNESQQFHYDVGKPWMYNSFIAKFDFPIYKTEETIKHEQDSLMEEFQPYYTFDNSVEEQQIDKFKEDFKDGIPGLPPVMKSILIDRLHRLYQAGIMNTAEYVEASKDTTAQIRVIDGKQVQIMAVNCIFSRMTAYEQLFNDEKLSAARQQLQRCNLTEYIEANLIYDKERSDTELTDLLSSIPIASGMVVSGQKVIDRGDIVDDNTCRVLESFEKEMKRRSTTTQELTTTLIGQLLFVIIMLSLFTIYLWLFRRDYLEKPRSTMMLYAMIVIFPVIVSLMMSHSFLSIYMLPLAMVPIFTRIFMDSRTAFVTHTVVILICAIAVKYQYEFIIIELTSGLVAIYSLRGLSSRAQLFKTAILVSLAMSATWLSLQLIQTDSLSGLDADMYNHFFVNGVLLLLCYPLMYIIEKTFGFTSNVTLFELSDTNKGVLRDLSEVAPGTFQHSITVGNLAAEIANRIGANSLLVRTGALYHDIGKMVNPVFFTENQAGVNPHEGLPYVESAKIIIGHVTEGEKLADKYRLPGFIKDFILTHHGTGITRYFYVKEKNDHPDEEVSKAPFTYPGPNPFTREQAILMMADTVEAATRSLTSYTEEEITAFVNKLIDKQVSDGFFTDCPITFSDIRQAKAILIDRLKSIYHTRIAYPELEKTEKDADKAAEDDPVTPQPKDNDPV